MIKIISDTIGEAIMTCLPFVERYAGLVIPVVRRVQIAGEESEPDSLRFIDQTFPVSCVTFEQDCDHDGFYKKVLPDSRYASLAYIEQLNSPVVQLSGAKDRDAVGRYGLRFVCWMNLQKLGIMDCYATHNYELFFVRMMRDKFVGGFYTDDKKTGFSVGGFSFVRRVPSDVFSRYYGAIAQSLFLYPYDFFAVDFEVTFRTNLACLDIPQPGEPINCITTW